MRIGKVGQVLLEIPVSEGRVGAIVIGGLNPVASIQVVFRQAPNRIYGT